jgi:hypothetical protein
MPQQKADPTAIEAEIEQIRCLGKAALRMRWRSMFGAIPPKGLPKDIIGRMIAYYFAHMKFPYIEENVNFLVDYHLVYATVIVYLIAHRAGHVWGLDELVDRMHVVDQYPALRPLVG